MADDFVFELGDSVAINTARFGVVTGKIYYRDADLIRILPNGVSDRLYDFPLVDGEFSPDLGFKAAEWFSKNPLPTFVEQQDLQAGQYFETFTADGELGPTFTIEQINVDDDIITVRDDTGAQFDIEFGYVGIPLDLPFAVLRVREPPAKVEDNDDGMVGINIEKPSEDVEVAQQEANLGIETPLDKVTAGIEESTAAISAVQEALAEGDEIDLDVIGFVNVTEVEKHAVKPTADRVYPDNVQRQDALQDFTSFLTVKQQQDVKHLRRIRQLVESLFSLKKDIIDFNPSNGQVLGVKPQSASLLSQLMENTHIPLRRPVLDTNIRVFESMTSNYDWTLHSFESRGAEDSWHNYLNIQDFDKFMKTMNDLQKGSFVAVTQNGRTNFWLLDNMMYNKLQRPWEPIGDEDLYTFKEDSDFFRGEIPDIDVPSVSGLISGGKLKDEKRDPSSVSIGKVNFSLRKGLGTITRRGTPSGTEVHIAPESAPIKADIIFPLRYSASLGTTRSGQILYDMVHSKEPIKCMSEILEETGPVSEVPQADSVLAIGVKGNTLGNIKLADFIGILKLRGLGPSEMLHTLSQYGLNKMELNNEVAEVLFEKVKSNINAIKNYLRTVREELNKQGVFENKPEVDNLLIELKGWLLETLVANEPMLAEIVKKFTNQSPRLTNSDYALISYLYVQEPDLFLAVAGQQAAQVAIERRLSTLRANQQIIHNHLAKERKEQNAGEAPKPNTCEHVAQLQTINRIDDDNERMYELSKFVIRYQGNREQNWIKCSVCARDLLCVHSFLELQQFMHPKERDVLRKELLLNFCGPVMGNIYTCRNCGQGMGELEFDNNIQFDDEGRPMMGRAEIVDKDAAEMEEREDAYTAPIDKSKLFDFGSDSKNHLYETLKDLSNRLGITPTREDYEHVIRRLYSSINAFPSREEFIADNRARFGPNKPLPDYDKLLQLNHVTYACAHLLIHIQTRIPDYIVSVTLPGCARPGFIGYPIGQEEDTTGIDYIACAAASIMKNSAPWNMTGLQKEPDAKRQKILSTKIMAAIQTKLIQDSEIQQLILSKRKYNTDIYGLVAGGERPRDELSPFFLPLQRTITPKEANEKGSVIIPEVTTHMTGTARANIWIQKANGLVEENGRSEGDLIIGSPFSDATCCFSSVNRPLEFWKKPSLRLPELPIREMNYGRRNTLLNVRFNPRARQNILPSPQSNMYYILFLNVCYQGERKGYPHEFGFNHQCPHCGLQLSPFEKSIEDIDVSMKPGAIEKEITKIVADEANYLTGLLEQQGVQVNEDTFTDLLNTQHKINSVEPYRPPRSQNTFDALREFALLDPPPVPTWMGHMEELITNFSKLTADADLSEIYENLAQISTIASDAMKALDGRLTIRKDKKLINTLMSITTLPPNDVAEVILTYFIIPIQRLINQVDPGLLKKLPEELRFDIADVHVQDIHEIIDNHISVIREFNSEFTSGRNSFAQAKLKFFIAQISQIPSLLRRTMISNLYGGERTYKYLIQALIFPPLATLLSPNDLPSPEYTQSAGAVIGDPNSGRLLTSIIVSVIKKYNEERISYSPEQIQMILEDLAEKEKNAIIKEIDRMSDEEKKIDAIFRRNRMGDRWGVGGTNAIREYDAEHFVRERIQRAKAGQIEFNSFDPNAMYSSAERPDNKYGGYSFGNDDSGGGYDTYDYNNDD